MQKMNVLLANDLLMIADYCIITLSFCGIGSQHQNGIAEK